MIVMLSDSEASLTLNVETLRSVQDDIKVTGWCKCTSPFLKENNFYLAGFEDEEGSARLRGMAYLCIFKDCHTKVVHGTEIV